jgi:hypothetical protein
MSTGPYPIYGPDDENAQNFPMPGDNPVPPLHDIPDALDFCPDCDGDGRVYSYDDDADDGFVPDSDRLMYLIQDIGETEAYQFMHEEIHGTWVVCERCEGTGRP